MPASVTRRRFRRRALWLADLVRHPWTYVAHRARFKVLAGPGFHGFGGGLFNPGAVRTHDGGVVLLAKGQRQHWLYAEPAEYMRGAPVVLSLDSDLRVGSAEVAATVAWPSAADTETEDFRLFAFAGEIWVNHTLIEVQRAEGKTGYLRSQVCLSRLDPAKKELAFLGHPRIDFQAQQREKNWVFVESGGNLYLLYSFLPYRVLRLVDPATLAFATVISRPLEIDFRDLGGFAAHVSYSTNPVPYDDTHLIVLLHQWVDRCGGRSYYHWAALLDRSSLAPRMVTSRPLVTGIGARGAMQGVLYVASVLDDGDDLVLFSGEGDSYLTRTRIAKAKIDRLWVPVPEAPARSADASPAMPNLGWRALL